MTSTDVSQNRLAQRLEQARRRLTTPPETIPRRPSPEMLPLSFIQERFWLLDQFEPGNPAYNRPMLLRLKGHLSLEALQQTLKEIVRRHDALRATFLNERGRPRQLIQPPFALPLSLTDLSRNGPEGRDEAVQGWLEAALARPFDLARGPLLRVELLQLAPDHHLFLLVAHHILCDAWSARLFIREMVQLYEAFLEGRTSPLPDLPIQYADFAYWQRNRLQSDQLQKELAYWQSKLAGAPAYLELPTDYQPPKFLGHQGALQTHHFPKTLAAQLKNLSRHTHTTLFMTMLAAFKMLLHHHTGQTDIVVGSPVAGRTHLELEPLIGVLFNTLVLRSDLSGDPTFQTLLQQVRRTALEAYAHQYLPFEKLVEILNPPRDLSRTPVFQVMFNFENLADAVPLSQHLLVEEVEFDHHVAYYELTVELIETAEGLKGLFFYKTDLFRAETIERLIENYQRLLERIVMNPAIPVSHLQPAAKDGANGSIESL